MNTIEFMKDIFLEQIEKIPLVVIAIKKEKKDKLNADKNVIEIPRKNGRLSRMRFEVKIPDGALKVKQEQLDESDWIVQFDDLTISYIDTVHGNVYFKATDYEVQEVE